MSDAELRPAGVFASASLTAHLARGALAVSLLAAAARVQTSAPLASLAFGVAALVALRGCPVCWTIGLFETLKRRSKPALAGGGVERL